jgi:hypothetical protein
MPKKSSKRAAPTATHGAEAQPLESLMALARRHPKSVEAIEFACELGILAAQALRQIAVGMREGSKVVARSHRADAVAATKRKRAVADASKRR